MAQGWIKLHRKIIDNPISNKPQYLSLWVHILIMANHKGKSMMWNGDILSIHEGQFVTGRKELSIKTGIPETTIEDILKYLERQQQIRQQKTTKFRLITVINWEKYQISDTKSDNKPTTSRQQADTNKNDNKENNDKNVIPCEPKDSRIPEVIKLFEEVNPSYETLFKNKTERSACERLLKKWTVEQIQAVVKILPEFNSNQFSRGKSITPYQMEKNLGFIKAFIESKKSNQRKVAVIK